MCVCVCVCVCCHEIPLSVFSPLRSNTNTRKTWNFSWVPLCDDTTDLFQRVQCRFFSCPKWVYRQRTQSLHSLPFQTALHSARCFSHRFFPPPPASYHPPIHKCTIRILFEFNSDTSTPPLNIPCVNFNVSLCTIPIDNLKGLGSYLFIFFVDFRD